MHTAFSYHIMLKWKGLSRTGRDAIPPHCTGLTSRHHLVWQVPIGELKVGLARHRALIFKFLADSSNLKSRILRGSYTGWRTASLH